MSQLASRTTSFNERFLNAVAARFVEIDDRYTTGRPSGKSRQYIDVTKLTPSYVKYRWLMRKREACIDVTIHFMCPEKSDNERLMRAFAPKASMIEAGAGMPLHCGGFGKRWAEVRFRLPLPGESVNTERVEAAARLMHLLLQRTEVSLQRQLGGEVARAIE